MNWIPYAQSLLGGALIGLAALLLLVANGRVAGVSGIVGKLLEAPTRGGNGVTFERLAFVAGLLVGPLVFLAVFGALPTATVEASLPVLIIGGLLVGFGTRLGSGCTSGHGVCGLARLSRRSAVAVAVFFAVAIVTVFVMEHVI